MNRATDTIELHGMAFYGYHGHKPEERELGQRFFVDLKVAVDLREAGRTDNLDATVDYGRLYRIAEAVVQGESRDLLESVAEAVAERVLAISKVESVHVAIRKPSAPIRDSVLEYAAVEIYRERGEGIYT